MSVFAAIADPVRRRILMLLRGGPMPAGAIAAKFEISRPAVSRHLRVLRDAGVVDIVPTDAPAQLPAAPGDGRERRYALRADGLADVERWLAQLRGPVRLEGLLGSPALDTEVRRATRDSTRAGVAPAGRDAETTRERGTA